VTGPSFSVVIPTYNRADLVRHAVLSVLAQTVEEFEVVVSDNQSTDETRAVIEGIGDPRVRYVQPPEHMVLPDHWEFARRHASGQMLMMLSDDDALLPTALEHFAQGWARGGDFLFCRQAEYRDHAFPPPEGNRLDVPAFTGRTITVDPQVFVGRLMAFQPKYNMHPSGFVFARSLAEAIAARNAGRVFETLGVEYFAWPIAAALANQIVHVDLPLVIIGRTAKSWGTNMVLLNPGEQKIESLVSDAQTERSHTPLRNFTLNNLILEGLLTAKDRFPVELAPYDVDMRGFVRATRSELALRQDQGIDVSRDLAELDAFVARNPTLGEHEAPAGQATLLEKMRRVPQRIRSRLKGRQIMASDAFHLEGDGRGFNDALGASVVLAQLVDENASRRRAAAS
jgi:hypothetical protein